VILFHRTDRAAAILHDGFRDGEGNYLTDRLWRGVWLSDQPLDENDGAFGSNVLTVEIPGEIAEPFEWNEEGKPYREFLIPALMVNRYAFRLVTEEEGGGGP
jgi:hypothetical protein